STLTSGYSLPSSHLIVSLLEIVERVRNLKSEVTSWNTTSRYSGWMSAFTSAPGSAGDKSGILARDSRLPQAQSPADQGLQPRLVIGHQDRAVVRPPGGPRPVDDGGSARRPVAGIDHH